jgi:hypothetical protein
MCVAIGGCAMSTGATAEPQSAWPAATYAGPIKSRIVYEEAGITLEVPSFEQTFGVTWSESYYVRNCITGDAICDSSKSPTIVLAEATSPFPAEERPDGTLKPLLRDTLVYVVTFADTRCVAVGPYRPGHESATRAAVRSCTVLNLIDATTGKVLFSSSFTDS